MGREVDSPRTIPGGAAVPDGTTVQIYRKTDLIVPAASVSVTGGKYDHLYDGSYGPIETRVTYGGETRIRDSWSIGQAGPLQLGDWPLLAQMFGHGVVLPVGHALQVTAGGVGRKVLIRDGIGAAAGIVYRQVTDNKPSPDFATNTSGQPRIDLIGYQVWTPGHAEEGRAELAILQGVPAAVPVPATPTQNPVAGTWFEPLAAVTLANGYATITAGNIRDLRSYLGSPASALLLPPIIFSAVSEVIIDGIFTAAFRNYRLIINIDTATVSDNLQAQLRAGGVNQVAANYERTGLWSTSGVTALNAEQKTAGTFWKLGFAGSGSVMSTDVSLFNPQRTQQTTGRSGNQIQGATTLTGEDFHLGHRLAAAYDGIRIFPATGLISGEVRAYGIAGV